MKGTGVAKKVLEVSRAIGFIEKEGFNAHFKFKFQAWDDVLPAVRNACVEAGLAILPSVTILSDMSEGNKKMIQMTLQLVDVESGESETLEWTGEAIDQQDKGVQKAATSAMKYFFLKLFMIPISDDTDTDADGPKPVPAPKAKQPIDEGLSWAMKTLGLSGADCQQRMDEMMAADKKLTKKSSFDVLTKELIKEANDKMAAEAQKTLGVIPDDGV